LVSAWIGHSLDKFMVTIYRLFLGNKLIQPNILTVFGMCFGFAATACIIFDYFLAGAVALLLSGFCDMLDGALARSTGKVTPFGGFFDSVLDRYTDLAVMGGIFLFFIMRNDIIYSSITFVAAIGTAIIPYARARAEAASVQCKAGLLERPERIVLLLIGLFFLPSLPYIIIILAVLTHVTVIQRIVHVYKALNS
jgi:phosphatidylglycerophosphate synthase